MRRREEGLILLNKSNMLHIEVGKPFKEFLGKGEGVVLEIIGSVGLLVFMLNNIREDEVKQFSNSNPMEFRMTAMEDVLMFTVKVGDLPWSDAPYSPHLSSPCTEIGKIPEGQGIALNIVLMDATTGIVKAIRTVGLGHDFSCHMKEQIERLWKKPFHINTYDQILDRIYEKYSPEDIAKISPYRCYIK